MPVCKRCGEQIDWRREGDRWVPWDTVHQKPHFQYCPFYRGEQLSPGEENVRENYVRCLDCVEAGNMGWFFKGEWSRHQAKTKHGRWVKWDAA